ncbi:MAG: hydrogenase maturation nickel metallochaperone HypA [Bacteroidales bacterium]|nr:hydrogenase maturation nickel metallochaperone HypA [Bacteroidales bacterium]
MHELSIAFQITELVLEEAKKHQADTIASVCLHIGKFAGIERDALYVAMEEAVRHTSLTHTRWDYIWIDALMKCEECAKEFVPDDYFKLCPYCQSVKTIMVKGRELHIQSIEIEYD